MLGGKLFWAFGQATANALSPNVVLVFRTTRSPRADDRVLPSALTCSHSLTLCLHVVNASRGFPLIVLRTQRQTDRQTSIHRWTAVTTPPVHISWSAWVFYVLCSVWTLFYFWAIRSYDRQFEINIYLLTKRILDEAYNHTGTQPHLHNAPQPRLRGPWCRPANYNIN